MLEKYVQVFLRGVAGTADRCDSTLLYFEICLVYHLSDYIPHGLYEHLDQHTMLNRRLRGLLLQLDIFSFGSIFWEH